MHTYRIWADIDLATLASNLRVIQKHVGPNVKVMGVLKADAYGHGAVAVARKLQATGIDAFGVGDSVEAVELRAAGVTIPIYILGALAGAEIERVVAQDIIPSVHSEQIIARLADECKRQNKKLKVNCKIDTGMGRLGVKPAEALALLKKVHDNPFLELEGVSTHFSSSSQGDLDFTNYQIMNFDFLMEEAQRQGIHIPVKHTASSSAVFSLVGSHYNMVRPGIALYGVNPGNLAMRALGLNPILSLKTQVIFIKNVPAGTSIGYNRTYFTKAKTKIATLPVGYNDGYRFSLSGKIDVLVRGRRCPVVGRVSMDYMMIDLGANSPAQVGDEVTLIGRQGNEEISVEEMADAAGTIVYEILTGLGKRVVRNYLNP